MRTMHRLLSAGVLAACSGLVAPAAAQQWPEPEVDIAWNKYYTVDEIYSFMRRLERAHPDLVTLREIGKSGNGQPLLMAIVNNEDTGAHDEKPAMWIDGNIHGNEVQAAEVVLYSLWFLAERAGENAEVDKLLERYSFYLMPIVNPDGRRGWFEEPTTANFYRGNLRPVDNDRDGLVDEDGYDDLDNDGSITQMWKKEPGGGWVRDENDPRRFTRAPEGEPGDWRYLGSEGIDNDGDGRVNEDTPGGDDMNRNWPAGWKPNYVQRGAGTAPLSNPETRAVAEWVRDHSNIAALQSYHNTGGMILRGPGSPTRESYYPAGDRRVYQAIAEIGEKLLPYYDYLITYEDLYTVHGGEMNFGAELMGIISYTNELWTSRKYFQGEGARPSSDDMQLWRDRLDFGTTFTPFTEVDHPQHGKVLVGGLNKWSRRATPTWMLEEEAHRNFAFTMLHADSMPRLSFGEHRIEKLRDGLFQITVDIENEGIIPTRLELAARRGIGRKDILEASLNQGEIVSAGYVRSWFDDGAQLVDRQPERLVINSGVPGEGRLRVRYFVAAPEGAEMTLAYDAEKAKNIETTIELRETNAGAQGDGE